MDAIRYFSRTGNTKVLAEAIGADLNLEAKDITEPLPDEVDTLYLGAAIYMTSIDKYMKAYAAKVDPKQVKRVVLFGTSGGVMSSEKAVSKLLTEQGVAIAPESLHLHGLVPKHDKLSDEQLEKVHEFTKAFK